MPRTQPLSQRDLAWVAQVTRAPDVSVIAGMRDGGSPWLLQWDCAGTGPAGVDLGSVRLDAALCYGPAAAEHVLAGWEQEAGRQAADVAYWDVVAALATPPDLGWFPAALAGQGRSDLTRHVLTTRRDAFLRDALARMPG